MIIAEINAAATNWPTMPRRKQSGQPEWLRALDQMASEIAHDIDNASCRSLCTEDMLENESLSERARGYLASIRRAIDDVAHTVGRLREIYRPREERVATDRDG